MGNQPIKEDISGVYSRIDSLISTVEHFRRAGDSMEMSTDLRNLRKTMEAIEAKHQIRIDDIHTTQEIKKEADLAESKRRDAEYKASLAAKEEKKQPAKKKRKY